MQRLGKVKVDLVLEPAGQATNQIKRERMNRFSEVEIIKI